MGLRLGRVGLQPALHGVAGCSGRGDAVPCREELIDETRVVMGGGGVGAGLVSVGVGLGLGVGVGLGVGGRGGVRGSGSGWG